MGILRVYPEPHGLLNLVNFELSLGRNFFFRCQMAMSTQAPSKQPEMNLNAAAAVLPMPAPMEIPNPGQGVQMDLKALLEDHILEHPLESAFHGCVCIPYNIPVFSGLFFCFCISVASSVY